VLYRLPQCWSAMQVTPPELGRPLDLYPGCYEVCTPGPFAEATEIGQSTTPSLRPSVGGTRPVSVGDARHLFGEVGGGNELIRRLLKK
jgi:hypothetical protein